MAGGAGFDGGAFHVECVHRAVVAVDVELRHFHRLQLFEAGLFGDLVLTGVGIVLQMAYISDVADVAHFVTDMLEVAEDEVEGDGGAGVAEVRLAIDGRSADIEADMTGIQWDKMFLLLR